VAYQQPKSGLSKPSAFREVFGASVASTFSRAFAKIVEKAEGKAADPVQFKKDIARLKDAGFIETKSGPGGGCWLTTKGRSLADRMN